MWLKFLIMGHYTYIKKMENGILTPMDINTI